MALLTPKALVSDVDLLFDSPASLNKTITFDSQPGQHVTINLAVPNNASAGGLMGAGWLGNGSMTIKNGIKLVGTGTIGHEAGSVGVVTVDGAGSKWTGVQYVGERGRGTLNIVNGGSVDGNGDQSIGEEPGSIGVATVDGTGSSWTNGHYLLVGDYGNGTLNISGGGIVTTQSAIVGRYSGSTGRVTIDVANGSKLNAGSGIWINNGIVRVVAGVGAGAGATFMPISACAWGGTGSLQAIGGTWNSTSHVFTVSDVQSGTSGTPVALNLGSTQRALINENATGWSVGASFLAATAPLDISFTATAIHVRDSRQSEKPVNERRIEPDRLAVRDDKLRRGSKSSGLPVVRRGVGMRPV